MRRWLGRAKHLSRARLIPQARLTVDLGAPRAVPLRRKTRRANANEFLGAVKDNAVGGGPMHGLAESIASAIFALVEYAGVPALLIWSWVRWFKRPKPRTPFSVLPLVGLAFATASVLLAGSSILYANFIDRFAYYDPRLMRIFLLGFVLSAAASGFGIAAVWKRSTLRWHVLACGVATLLFWFVAAAGE